jgi:hypothetical protein
LVYSFISLQPKEREFALALCASKILELEKSFANLNSNKQDKLDEILFAICLIHEKLGIDTADLPNAQSSPLLEPKKGN